MARSQGAAFRRRHVSYDVSANGLRGCFSQLRVGGASRLPLPPFLAPFLPLTQKSMVPGRSQEVGTGRSVIIWVDIPFFVIYSR